MIQCDQWSGPALWLRPFAIREAHVESLMQRAAEESSRDVEEGNLIVLLGCKADVKLDHVRIYDLRGDIVIVARLLEIALADQSNFAFVNCRICH